MPELSVIIPVYNTEQYLRECLDSVVTQTYKDMEIICVNDGSTDNSLEILNEYKEKDTRIKVITIKNQGPAIARNTGLYAATGKYITFVDSDDYLEKNTYEKALQHITDVDLVCFGVDVFGDKISSKSKPYEEYYKLKYNDKVMLNNEIRFSTNCSSCNKIFKRYFIEKKQIKFPDGFRYEDAGFYWKYILNSQSAFYIKDCFYKYRRRTNSIMSETFTNGWYAIDHMHILNDLFDYMQNRNLYEKYSDVFEILFKDYFLVTYGYIPCDRRKNLLEQASQYAQKFFSDNKKNCKLIHSLISKKYKQLFYPDYSLMEEIFSLKNAYKEPGCLYKKKILSILGMKYEIKKTIQDDLEEENEL